jgi:hypothetical protein
MAAERTKGTELNRVVNIIEMTDETSITELERKVREIDNEARQVCREISAYSRMAAQRLDSYFKEEGLADKVQADVRSAEFSPVTPDIKYKWMAAFTATSDEYGKDVDKGTVFNTPQNLYIAKLLQNYSDGFGKLEDKANAIRRKQISAYCELGNAMGRVEPPPKKPLVLKNPVDMRASGPYSVSEERQDSVPQIWKEIAEAHCDGPEAWRKYVESIPWDRPTEQKKVWN